eukprot:GHVP01000106.1.p1 GENE.GHVP01000106.1~~GHVP01000106.1.p1  ORF type:complete len:334 (-),score=91.86 GHVP01000106.1:547-1548(-)
MTRPENEGPPQRHYDEEEARRYTQNSRIQKIQQQIALRSLELADLLPEEMKKQMNYNEDELDEDDDESMDGSDVSEVEDFVTGSDIKKTEIEDDEEETIAYENPTPKLILDIGCGSGLSGQVISEAGHWWIGIDISRAMLDVAVERKINGELMECDMGSPCPFRPGIFDGVISISALQWLCVANSKEDSPVWRLRTFFRWLGSCMKHDAIACLQFYPENKQQQQLIIDSAKKEGLQGAIVDDFADSKKARKQYFLVSNTRIDFPEALKAHGKEEVKEGIKSTTRREERRISKIRKTKLSNRQKVHAMKDRQRRKGKNVREDNKYTGRRRKAAF